MKGRIVAPFLASIAQLNTAATAANTPGYDSLFSEPDTTIDVLGNRATARQETIVQCRCQVESGTFERQQMTPMGNAPASQLVLVFHWSDLTDANLVGADNRPKLQVNDRLVQIIRIEDNVVMTDFSLVPVYITDATPSGYGFGGSVNLLICRFGDRPQAQRAGG